MWSDQININTPTTGSPDPDNIPTYAVFLGNGKFVGEQKIIHWVNPNGFSYETTVTQKLRVIATCMTHAGNGGVGFALYGDRRGGYAFMTWIGDRWLVTSYSGYTDSGNTNRFFAGVGI
jgi:hypothetical protein